MSVTNEIEEQITKQHKNAVIGICAAILNAQKEMGNAVKGSANPFFKSKYADLNSIREAVMPALHKNGISVLQPTVHVDGKNFVKTVLLHESGQEYSSLTEIICAKQNDPQAQGSAISYARRYGLQSLLNVGAEDDDGESAMDRNKKPERLKSAAALELDPANQALAKAQAAVALKKVSKKELLAELAATSDSITEAVEALDALKLKKFVTFVEGKLK